MVQKISRFTVFIESKDLDYVRTIGEEFENSKHKECSSPFENLDESKNEDEKKNKKIKQMLQIQQLNLYSCMKLVI